MKKESIRFVDLRKEARKNEGDFSFLENLNLLDFRDDLKYK